MKISQIQSGYLNNLMKNSENLDNNFKYILEEKVNIYKETEPAKYKKVIKIDTVLTIGRYLDSLKPKSKYREYKYQILEFIDILQHDSNLTKREVVALVQNHLSGIITFLQSEHSFSVRNDWFWSGIFNLVLDVILILIGIAKYYYYIPIFTLIAIIRNMSKQKRAKKEGRYIDF